MGTARNFILLRNLIDPMFSTPSHLDAYVSKLLDAQKTFFMISAYHSCNIWYDATKHKFEITVSCDPESKESIEAACNNVKLARTKLLNLCGYIKHMMYDIFLQLEAPFGQGGEGLPTLEEVFKTGRHLIVSASKKRPLKQGSVPFPSVCQALPPSVCNVTPAGFVQLK
jgi:hypothetical protein